ncbi:helix-turn-helix domain-containing protein [Actinomycetes bacterium KLBMP 9759]
MAEGNESAQRIGNRGPLFYTVAEVADVLRVDRATIYRAIRDDGFPAVRIRTRYVIPAAAVEQLAMLAAESGGCIDIGALAAERRTARELRPAGGSTLA